MFETAMTWNDFFFMLRGAGTTLIITFWAVLGGTVLGVIFGLIRASAPAWIGLIVGGILDIFRSVPLLIQLVLVNSFNSIARIGLDPFKIACITLALYTAA
jgi:polar amino acid transport system permease protein